MNCPDIGLTKWQTRSRSKPQPKVFLAEDLYQLRFLYPDDYLGLFYCELMSRLPYLPRLFGKTGDLRARSSSSQIEILSGPETVGRVVYWNRDWSPTHLRYLKPNCGVATLASAQFVSRVEEYSRKKLRTFWHLKRIERQKEYGPWDTKELLGEVVPI